MCAYPYSSISGQTLFLFVSIIFDVLKLKVLSKNLCVWINHQNQFFKSVSSSSIYYFKAKYSYGYQKCSEFLDWNVYDTI